MSEARAHLGIALRAMRAQEAVPLDPLKSACQSLKRRHKGECGGQNKEH